MKNAPGGDRKKKTVGNLLLFYYTMLNVRVDNIELRYKTKQKEYLKKKKKIQNFHGPFKVVIFDEYKSTRFPTLFLRS